MNYIQARNILRAQDMNIRKISNTRFCRYCYEFRVSYCPGFVPMAKVDYRRIGRRNFQWFTSVDLSKCYDLNDALEAVYADVEKQFKR